MKLKIELAGWLALAVMNILVGAYDFGRGRPAAAAISAIFTLFFLALAWSSYCDIKEQNEQNTFTDQ